MFAPLDSGRKERVMLITKCPAIESSKFLCDRFAEYHIDGALWCNVHARRLMAERQMQANERKDEWRLEEVKSV